MESVSNESLIRALSDSFAKAFNSGDIDAIMKHYVQDDSFVILDVVPREGYRGANTYRRNWTEMFSHFKEKPSIAILDLQVTADDNVGFGYSFQRVTGIDTNGAPVDRTVRVTNGYRKIGNEWLIALEHVSVPVDLKTGKAVFNSQP